MRGLTFRAMMSALGIAVSTSAALAVCPGPVQAVTGTGSFRREGPCGEGGTCPTYSGREACLIAKGHADGKAIQTCKARDTCDSDKTCCPVVPNQRAACTEICSYWADLEIHECTATYVEEGYDCKCQRGCPAVSEWGLVAMTLICLTAGTVLLMIRGSDRIRID